MQFREKQFVVNFLGFMKGDFITLLEEIQNGENAALEFKEAKRWDENLVKKS